MILRDFLGRELHEGDTIVYARAWHGSASLACARIKRFNFKVGGQPCEPEFATKATITVEILPHGARATMRKPHNLVKVELPDD
jgi:hypothetical protein